MSPDTLAIIWITAAAICILTICTLGWIAHDQAQRCYRAGWVDRTEGHAYGYSYRGKIRYAGRHDGGPAVDLGGWLPPTPGPSAPPAFVPWAHHALDRIEALERAHEDPAQETTLIGTVIYPAGPPLPPHIAAMAQAVKEAWEPIEREYEQRQETDTAWTKRMARELMDFRRRVGLEGDLTAIGAGDGTGGSGET